MARYSIRNVYFPENNFLNSIIFYEVKSSTAGHQYYICTFTRKIMCVLIIVLLKDINQVAKTSLYIAVNLMWLAYIILGDPLKTKTTRIVSIINEVSYIGLIISSYITISSTFILCILMVLRSSIGILMIILWNVLIFTVSQDFIDTIKPFYFMIEWKIKEIDPDMLSKTEELREKAILSKASSKKVVAIN